jgi:CDGSH-type Zn-finger protein
VTCRVTVIPDGPVLVRGARVVIDDSGAEHPVSRPVVAICQCGHSQRAPWCDGTHKVSRERGSHGDEGAGYAKK